MLRFRSYSFFIGLDVAYLQKLDFLELFLVFSMPFLILPLFSQHFQLCLYFLEFYLPPFFPISQLEFYFSLPQLLNATPSSKSSSKPYYLLMDFILFHFPLVHLSSAYIIFDQSMSDLVSIGVWHNLRTDLDHKNQMKYWPFGCQQSVIHVGFGRYCCYILFLHRVWLSLRAKAFRYWLVLLFCERLGQVQVLSSFAKKVKLMINYYKKSNVYPHMIFIKKSFLV